MRGITRRTTRRACLALMALLLAAAPVLGTPHPAHAFGFWSGVCKVDVTVDFGSYLVTRQTGQVKHYVVSGSGTGCTAIPNTTSVNLLGDGYALVVNCEEFVIQPGGVNFGFDPGFPSDAQSTGGAASGTLASALVWEFPGADPTTFDAVAVLQNTDTSQLTTCENSGLSKFHYTGRLVFQDPTLS